MIGKPAAAAQAVGDGGDPVGPMILVTANSILCLLPFCHRPIVNSIRSGLEMMIVRLRAPRNTHAVGFVYKISGTHRRECDSTSLQSRSAYDMGG